MKAEMSCVYSLSYKGSVFYIGCTNNMAKRYVTHLSGAAGLRVHSYIKEIIANGEIPIMRLLYYLPTHEARLKEKELISIITKAGHDLKNDACYYTPSWPWEIVPNTSNVKEHIAFLKYQTQVKEENHNFWKEYYKRHEQAGS